MKFIILIFLFIFQNSFGQSSFLGSKTNIQISIINAVIPLSYEGYLYTGRFRHETVKNRILRSTSPSLSLTINRVLNETVK